MFDISFRKDDSMSNGQIVVRVELAEDEGRSSITPGWEVHIKMGNLSFALEERMQRDDLSKAKAISIGQNVATLIGAEFKLIG